MIALWWGLSGRQRVLTSVFFVALAILEGIADDALHAFPGVDVFLHRNLVGRALFKDATSVHVCALGVLSDHHKIDVPGLDGFQRTQT